MRVAPFVFIVLFLCACADGTKNLSQYDQYPTYNGNDLGLNYTPAASTFTLWSPIAKKVSLHLYTDGQGGERKETIPLSPGERGTWTTSVPRDLAGLFYTFQVETGDILLDETPGIYARAVGVNGRRAAIVPPESLEPPEWESDRRPPFQEQGDAIIYEMHVRDFTIHPSSGSQFPGKYLGVAESGTHSPSGKATGLDHLKEMGVTHVHLLPVYDYRSVNEEKLDSPQYNWGYDPQNYNVPEGSYASDPYDPTVRIREFKQMVKGLHEAGIRVVMDVVYNHTGATEKSNFNLEVPGYYYRHTEDGKWSDAASCGNETASERTMMRKYIIESCAMWVREYHIDGFRFDLMGIHDIETMNTVSARLLEIEPSLIFYGEGWTAGKSPLPDSLRALKANTAKLERFAAFSDDLRDGLKGSVFDEKATGLVNGGTDVEQSIRFGIVAATWHPQVDYTKVNYSKTSWAREPWQCINYVSCHDNHTLADKLKISGEGKFSIEQLKQMDKLANAIVLTSQGVSFLHAGEEMMRTKKGVENSFNRPDSVNAIDWRWKDQYADVFYEYKALIALRKQHPVFRLPSTASIQDNLRFLDTPDGAVAYQLSGKRVKDSWSEVVVIANGTFELADITLPDGDWTLSHRSDGGPLPKTTVKKDLKVAPSSLYILTR